MTTNDPYLSDSISDNINETSKNTTNHQTFSTRLLDWFEKSGRHDLPWQQHKTDTPKTYHVWLSEVMLQQTQVTTVIPYFLRFIASFPTVQDLADAEWDLVAEHWAGLGYYARARNLHKGAKQLVAIIEQTGDFPQTVSEWENISGVGRSTAGAIVAMGLHGYGVICDGNVKRVLTRWAGIDGDITKSATNKQLWALAEMLTPTKDSGLFAQAMMDMGATVCVRTKPACLQQHPPQASKATNKATSKSSSTEQTNCPLQSDCLAHAQGKQLAYPVKAKKQPKPSKYSYALLINNPQGKTLWIQRPDTGIWGGLWCLPLQFIHKLEGKKNNPKTIETSNDEKVYEKEYNTAEQIIDGFLKDNHLTIDDAFHLTSSTSSDLASDPNPSVKTTTIKHTLTHFHWFLSLQTISLTAKECLQLSTALDKADINHQWLTPTEATSSIALPKAMLKLFEV